MTTRKVDRQFSRRIAALLVLSFIAFPVFAHPSHDHAGFFAGLLHPLFGLDHLLAAFGIGLWAQARKQAFDKQTLVALVLTGIALLGGVGFAGLFGIGLFGGMLETLLAVTVLLTGLLVLTASRLSFWIAAALAAVFMLVHASAHFVEMPAAGANSSLAVSGYIAGFIAATLGLFMLGAFCARLFAGLRFERGLPLSGAMLMVCGTYLLGTA